MRQTEAGVGHDDKFVTRPPFSFPRVHVEQMTTQLVSVQKHLATLFADKIAVDVKLGMIVADMRPQHLVRLEVERVVDILAD